MTQSRTCQEIRNWKWDCSTRREPQAGLLGRGRPSRLSSLLSRWCNERFVGKQEVMRSRRFTSEWPAIHPQQISLGRYVKTLCFDQI
jgi:hypothetical protein